MKKSIRLITILIIFLSALFGRAPGTSAQPPVKLWIVSNTNDEGTGSLRHAVENALNGDVIQFAPSLAGQTITLASTIDIEKNITIDGEGVNPRVEISGGNAVRIFLVDASPTITVNIKNVVLKNGRQTGLTYQGYGGALFVGNNTNLLMENVHIKNNTAFKAGAMYISPYGVVTISNSAITNNEADYEGGAIYVASIGILNLRNSTIFNNVAGSAGTLYFTGATNYSTIENNVFENNTALTGSAITGQLGNARIEIRNNLFTGNQATGANGVGGAVRFSASTIPTLVILENNTFYNNSATLYGGAAYLEGGVIHYLINNTFSHNAAATGGNLYLAAGASVSRMYNNILANNAGGGDCFAFYNSYRSGSNNLVEDGNSDCLPSVMGDPGLLPLANNGGPTQTMALEPDSPAINAGDNTRCTSHDQRGVIRPQNSICDIGAYELDNTPPSVTINQAEEQADPTSFPHIQYKAVFSEPINTTTFTSQDVLIGGTTGATTATISEVAPHDGTTFNVTISGMTTSGAVTATIPGDIIEDIAGNKNTASTSSDNLVDFILDITPPTVVSINRVGNPLTSANEVQFEVTFSEPVIVSGSQDFHLTTSNSFLGAFIWDISGSGSIRTVTVNTGYYNNTIRLDIPASSAIMDLGGNLLDNLPFTSGETYTIIKHPTFADVPMIGFGWAHIESVYAAGITGGCTTSPLNYCPNNSVNRAQMAIFLLRGIHGSAYTPPPATGTVFNDVPSNAIAAAWIEQLVAEGITGGCGGGNYCPNNSVTRSQMAIFLLRAKYGSSHTPPAATGTVFADIPSNAFAAAWIEQLVAEGITGGCGGGNYCPNNPVTRAQMAIFLVRTFNLPMP